MKKLMLSAAVAFMALGFTACGEPDDGDGNNNNNDNQENVDGNKPSDNTPDTPGEPTTPAEDPTDDGGTPQNPEQSKETMQATAEAVLAEFKPEDQKETVDFFTDFADMYGDIELPDSWFDQWEEDDEDDPYWAPARVARRLASSLRGRRVFTLGRSAETFIFRFSDYSGLYEVRGGQWTKVADSDNELRFTFDLDGQKCVYSVIAEGQNPRFTYSDDETDVDVYAPKKTTVTASRGSKTFLKCVTAVDFDESAHTARVDVNTEVANLKITAAVDVNDSQMTENQTLSVNGKNIISTASTIKGNNMADRKAIENLAKHPTTVRFDDMFKEGVANVDILGKVQFRGKISSLKRIIDEADNEWDSWNMPDRTAAYNACMNFCETLNTLAPVYFYFDGTGTQQGSMVFEPKLWEETWYDDVDWGYDAMPKLRFADGTTYEFVDYFTEARFQPLCDMWESLIDSYRSVFDF